MTEGHAWGLAGAAELAEETLALVLQVASTETPYKRAHAGLAFQIAGFAGNLLAGRSIGTTDQQP